MTVSSTTRTAGPYAGTGTPGPFTFAFKVFQVSDVLVVQTDNNGVSTTLALTTNYNVSLNADQNGNPGGSITLTANLPTGYTLTMSSQVPELQGTSITNNGGFYPKVIETALDYLTVLVQQLQTSVNAALQIPLGQIAFNAQGKRITNLGNGTQPSDAVNLAQVQAMIVGGAAPALAGASGSSFVGYTQAGVGVALQTVQQRLRYLVFLQDYGGADDNSTDNTTAFTNAKTLLANGTVKLPFRNSGVYKFSTASTNLLGVVFDPDQGVGFSSTETNTPLSSTSGIRTTRNINLYLSNLNYNYQLSSQMGKPFDAKTLFLSDATSVHPTLIGLNLSGLINESNPWPNSDVWTSASPSITTTEPYPFVNWSSLTASTWYMSTLPVRGGDEITGSFDTAGLYNRVAIVRTSTGYYGLYAPGGGAAPVFFQKTTGSTGTTQTIDVGTQFTTQPQYYAETATWTIRIIDRRHFEVLLNGVAALTVATVTDIFRAGFGVMQTGGATSMSVTGWVKTQLAPVAGRQPVSVIIYGDSLSADIHGGWPYAMREALDGSNGCRVMNVNNQAVSGYTSTQALALMQSVGVVGYSYCVIGIGTNDIQQGFTPQATIANINAMAAICTAANCVPIFWIPPLWYTQTEAGAGTGQASTGSAAGSPIRATILRYCAVNGFACVDLTMVTGPVDVRYLKSTLGVSNADPMVRDNIHPTAYSYRLIGNAIARRILGLMVPSLDRSVVFQQLNPPMLNSWTDVTGGSRISYATAPDGKVTLAGVATAGTKTDGTAIFAVPENLRPSALMRFAVMMNQSVAPNYTSALVQIDTAGNLTVYGVTNANYISLDNISYYTAG